MLGSVLLLGCILAAQVDVKVGDDLKLEVHRLVRQFDAPQLARRDAAEAELLRLGPEVLDLLPPISPRTPAEVKQRICRIQQKLEQLAAESVAKASLVTLHSDAMPLSKVLAALGKQSGNKIVDFRRRFGHQVTYPELKVDFDKTPFWQALDQVLDQAKLTVYPFGEPRAIKVVGREDSQLSRCATACYSGPFRFEPLLIRAQRDLRDPDGKSLRLRMQVTWEPRINPISLKQPMADLKAVDEDGNPLAVDDSQAELEVPTGGNATAVNLVLPFALPPRSVKQIASLQGTLTAMIPGRVETFRFDNLTNAKNVEKRIAGVSITLEQVRKNNQLWEVRMRVRFDKAYGALASHRGWIFNNKAYLEGPDGKQLSYDSMETTRQTENEVGIAYLFALDGPLTDYTFVYKTPGVIVQARFDYEISGVKLP